MNEDRNYEMKVTCMHCKREFVLKVRFEDYLIYTTPNRPYVQDIFPYLNPTERELIISATCADCWDKMFNALLEEVE